MTTPGGTRIGWSDVPATVRSSVDSILGDEVTEAVSQHGGFSPGSADRVRTRSGLRAFVKAVSAQVNPQSAQLHRREAHIAARLPQDVPAPRLLGTHDDGVWVALVFTDVDGRHPHMPWHADELELVLRAVGDLGQVAMPTELADLVRTADDLADAVRGFHRLREEPDDALGPWATDHLDLLCRLAESAPAALAGDSLVHTDIRADNLLVDATGAVFIVDLPWASRGPGWLDTLAVLINVATFGGHDVDALLARHLPPSVASAEAVDAALAGLAGYFLDEARRPAPAGIPTVRAFQAAQGHAVLRVLAQRV